MAQYPFIASKYGSAQNIYGSASAAGTTVIGTPADNSDLRLLEIEIPEDATTGTAGEYQITVSLAGTVVYSVNVYMGTAGGGTGGALFQKSIPFNSLNFNSGTGGQLTVTLATALSTGSVNINAYFD